MKRFLLLLMGFLALGALRPVEAQTPSLSIADATTIESNSGVRELLIPVSLSAPQTFDVAASFKTRDISALAGSDYQPVTAGQIVIKAGQTRANILLRVVGDTVEEKDETLLVQIGAPKRATISDSDSIVSIKDNDYGGQISIGGITVTEGNSGQKLARLEVGLSTAPLHDVSVAYKTTDDSAKAPGDYIPTQGTLLFRPGRRFLSVLIPVVGDVVVENNERFFVRISAPGVAVAKGLGLVTIVNDEVKSSGKIVFTSARSNPSEIYVINADGTNLTKITNNNNYWIDDSPSFSHDGSKITYASDRDGVNGELAGDRALWVMDAAGTNPRRLVTLGEHFPFHPRFSPDNQKIAFSVRDSIGTESQSTLHVVNADGSDLRTVATDIFSDSDFGFSPDGGSIVYNGITPQGKLSINRINLDGSNETVVPQSNFDYFFPRFTPEGNQIAFVYPRNFTDNLLVYQPHAFNFDGSNMTRLTTQSDASFHNFCFSPDGNQIAYTQAFINPDPDGAPIYQIRVAKRDGSNARQIAQGYGPDWAPGSVPAPPRVAPAHSPSAGNS